MFDRGTTLNLQQLQKATPLVYDSAMVLDGQARRGGITRKIMKPLGPSIVTAANQCCIPNVRMIAPLKHLVSMDSVVQWFYKP